MEILDIVDENGVPTGETIDRELAHKTGARHRTSHVWIARYKDGKVELLLQRRSENKDSHPGCLDISSAGHIPAGCTYLESAIRELKEELSIDVSISELHFCGKKRKKYKKIFHDKEFYDNQVSNVYIMFRDVNIEELTVQETEVSEVLWKSFDEVFAMASDDSCITPEEMCMLKNFIADHPEYI